MDNSFAYWQALTPAQQSATLQQRLSALPPSARAAALASELDGDATPTDSRSTLNGLPYLAKDLFDLAGQPTRASSTFLHLVRPKPADDAELIDLLSDQGARCVGKTHLNEFAYGLSGRNIHYGNVPHPHHPDRLSGGSSSGSAWAVAAGLAPFALGTDTGGSIRVPASYCGLHAIRLQPQYLMEGCFPLAPRFDTAGWFTQSATDLKTTIEALLPVEKAQSQLRLLNALPALQEWVEPDYHQAYLQRVADLPAVEEPGLSERLAQLAADGPRRYSVLQSNDAWQVHADWLDEYQEQYNPIVWQRIDRGRHWDVATMTQAEAYAAGMLDFFNDCFCQYDAIILPAVPHGALREADLNDEARGRLLLLTVPASISGLPAVTIPVDAPDGLSGGLQVIFPFDQWATAAAVLQACS